MAIKSVDKARNAERNASQRITTSPRARQGQGAGSWAWHFRQSHGSWLQGGMQICWSRSWEVLGSRSPKGLGISWHSWKQVWSSKKLGTFVSWPKCPVLSRACPIHCKTIGNKTHRLMEYVVQHSLAWRHSWVGTCPKTRTKRTTFNNKKSSLKTPAVPVSHGNRAQTQNDIFLSSRVLLEIVVMAMPSLSCAHTA